MNPFHSPILFLLLSFAALFATENHSGPEDRLPRECPEFMAVAHLAKIPKSRVAAALLAKKLPPLPESNNEGFHKVFALGTNAWESGPETSHLDFKGLRLEIVAGKDRYVIHIDSAIKPLNDGPFLGYKAAVDKIVDMQILAANEMFAPGSEFRKKMTLDPANADAHFREASKKMLDKFNADVASVPELMNYLRQNKIKPEKLVTIGWANALEGMGHGDVAAGFAAKFRRRGDDENYGSYNDTKAAITAARDYLIKRADEMIDDPALGKLFGVTHSNLGLKTLDEGAYELAKKNGHDLEKLGKKIADRYGVTLSEVQLKTLRDYVESVDNLSAPIYQVNRDKLNWDKPGAAFTGDLRGGGARNLAVLEARIRDAGKVHTDPLAIVVRDSRRSERETTYFMKEQTDFFAKTVKDFLREKGIKTPPGFTVDKSGDDMLARLPPEVVENPALLLDLTRRIGSKYPGSFRLTAVVEKTTDTGEKLSVETNQLVSAQLENLHKIAYGEAEAQKLPYRPLNTVTILPRAEVDSRGRVTVRLFAALPNGALAKNGVIDPRVLKSFEEAMKSMPSDWKLATDKPIEFVEFPIAF